MDICGNVKCKSWNEGVRNNCMLYMKLDDCRDSEILTGESDHGAEVPYSDRVMPLFDKHNDNLVWLIGHLSFLNVTQKRLNEENYNKAFKMLEVLRIDLYEGKA